MINERKDFWQIYNKFCENGIFKQVYASEKVLVCNVFNQMYVMFVVDLMKEYTDSFPGITMNSVGLRNVLKRDAEFAIEYITNLSAKDREDALMVIDEDFFQHMYTHKQEFERRSPSKDVDLAFEQEIFLHGKEALKKKSTQKRRFFC